MKRLKISYVFLYQLFHINLILKNLYYTLRFIVNFHVKRINIILVEA